MDESLKALDNTYKVASMCSISMSELLDMDIRTVNKFADGFVTSREIKLNDDMLVGHVTAGKTAEAVWGSKDFSKPIEPIVLHEQTDEEIEAEWRRQSEEFASKYIV